MQHLLSFHETNHNNRTTTTTTTTPFFVESAYVHGNYYGTSWQSIIDIHVHQQKRCILDIDVQGVQRLKELQQQPSMTITTTTPPTTSSERPTIQFQPKYIFIAPPSLDTLYERLQLRNTETVDSLHIRYTNAANEVSYGVQTGNFDVVLTNDNLAEATQQLAHAIQQLYGLW
jgi:guanylate kinase